MHTCFNREGNSGCEVSTALKRCSSSWVWMGPCLDGFFPSSSSAAFASIDLGSFSMASNPPSVSLLSATLDISTSLHLYHLQVSYSHRWTPAPGSETRPCADPFLVPSQSRAWLGPPVRVQDLVHPTDSRSSRSWRTSGGLADVLGASLCPSRTVLGALTNRLSSSSGPLGTEGIEPPLCGTRSPSGRLLGDPSVQEREKARSCEEGGRCSLPGRRGPATSPLRPMLGEEQRSCPMGLGGGSPSDGPRKTRGRNERKRERRIGILPRNGRGGHVARIWTGEDLDRRHRRTRRKERSEHVDDGVQVDPACSSAGVEAAGWKKTRTIVPTFGRAKEPGRMQAWMSGGRVVSAWRRWQDVSPVQDARNGSCAGCGHPYPQTEDAVRAFVQATAKTAVHPEGTPMGCTEHVIPPGTSTSSCILPAFRSPPMSRMPPWPGRRFTSALVFLDRRLGRAEPGPGGTSTKRTPRRCCEAADLAMRKSELRRNRGPSALLREEQKTRGCRGNGVVRRRNLPNIHETRTRGPTVLSEAQTRQHPCIDDESIQRGHATGDGGSWKRSGSNGCRFCERSTPKGIAFQWSPKLDKCCADLSC